MQGVISKSKNVMPRTRGWLKSVAAILALGLGLAGLAAQVAAAEQAYPVVRFYNERTGTHFYTIDTAERDQVLRLYPWFDYEGVQFYAYKTQVAGSQPVYRFFNSSTGTHFYTIVPEEKDYVLVHFPVFVFEGPVYYAMSAPMPPAARTSTGSSIREPAPTSTRPARRNATTSRRRGRGSRSKAWPTRSSQT